MIDYLLDLLEAVEEVRMETSILSLSQEEESYPRRQGRRAEKADVEEKIASPNKVLEEEQAGSTKVDEQEPWESHEETHEGAETVLEKKLGASWHLTSESPQAGRGKARTQDMEGDNLLPGTYLLESLQKGRRMAAVGGGGRAVLATSQVVQQGEGVAQASYADFAAFDRAVERDARCYDNGFSLF